MPTYHEMLHNAPALVRMFWCTLCQGHGCATKHRCPQLKKANISANQRGDLMADLITAILVPLNSTSSGMNTNGNGGHVTSTWSMDRDEDEELARLIMELHDLIHDVSLSTEQLQQRLDNVVINGQGNDKGRGRRNGNLGAPCSDFLQIGAWTNEDTNN